MKTIKAALVICSVFILLSCTSSARRAHQYCLSQGLEAGTERYQECYEKRIVKVKIVITNKEPARADRKRDMHKGDTSAYGRTDDAHDDAAERKRLEHEQGRPDKKAWMEARRQAKDERAEQKHGEHEHGCMDKEAGKESHHQAKDERAEQKHGEHGQGHLDKETGKESHHQAKDKMGSRPEAAKKGNGSQRSAGAALKVAAGSEVPGPVTPSAEGRQTASGALVLPGSGSSDVCLVNRSGGDAKFFVNGTLRKLRNGAKMSLPLKSNIEYTAGGKKHSYVLAGKSDCYEIKMVGGTRKIQGAKNK